MTTSSAQLFGNQLINNKPVSSIYEPQQSILQEWLRTESKPSTVPLTSGGLNSITIPVEKGVRIEM